MTPAAPAAVLRPEAVRLGESDSQTASAPGPSDTDAAGGGNDAGNPSLAPPVAAEQAHMPAGQEAGGSSATTGDGVPGLEASPSRPAPSESTRPDAAPVSSGAGLASSSGAVAGTGSAEKGGAGNGGGYEGGNPKASGANKARARMAHAMYEAPIYNTSASAPVWGVGFGCVVCSFGC